MSDLKPENAFDFYECKWIISERTPQGFLIYKS